MTMIRMVTGALVASGLLLGISAPSADDTTDLRPAADRLSPLPVKAVTIHDTFWAPRIEVNRMRTLDHVLQEIESTGGLRNFDIAAGKATGKFGTAVSPCAASLKAWFGSNSLALAKSASACRSRPSARRAPRGRRRAGRRLAASRSRR